MIQTCKTKIEIVISALPCTATECTESPLSAAIQNSKIMKKKKQSLYYLCVLPLPSVFFTQWICDSILGCNQHALQMMKYTSKSKGAEAPLWITNISPMTGSYNTLIASRYYAQILLLHRKMGLCTSYCYSSHKTYKPGDKKLPKKKCIKKYFQTVTWLCKHFEAATSFCWLCPVWYIYINKQHWYGNKHTSESATFNRAQSEVCVCLSCFQSGNKKAVVERLY